MNRIDRKFKQLRVSGKKAFIAFITAGYPSLAVTEKLILEFSKIGVDIIELGVPFSDPMADGPIIQQASKTALEKGVNLDNIFSMVKECRKKTDIPICLMTYYNPVFRYGEKRFTNRANLSGVDGVIIPDLIPEEAKSFIKCARADNLSTIFFLAPTSTKERIKLISSVSTGFIYYVSLTGVTGPRKNLPEDCIKNISLIKQNTQKPVCVGFGISTSGQIKEINKNADGVIIGSSIVAKIKENIGNSDLVSKVGGFVKDLIR
ncbi:MAG: tryptophan synthase subunit alpha [Candidatus Omnitrophota bacterium]